MVTRRQFLGGSATSLAALAAQRANALRVTPDQTEAPRAFWRRPDFTATTVATPAQAAAVAPTAVAPSAVSPNQPITTVDEIDHPDFPPLPASVDFGSTPFTTVPFVPPSGRSWVTASMGRSVRGLDIPIYTFKQTAPRASVLIMSAIHGNERVTAPVANELMTVIPPADIEVSVVPVLNVDGWSDYTRHNANNVDLNRNFGWAWNSADGGPQPFSEPETRAAVNLITVTRPTIVVWIHQPIGYMASVSPGADGLAQAWAQASGHAFRPRVSQHGGAESWTAYGTDSLSLLLEIGATNRDAEANTEQLAYQRAGFEAMLSVI